MEIRLQSFLILALILHLPQAVYPQSIATDKPSYTIGEPIDISWTYPSRAYVNNGDWIGIYDDGSLSQGGTLPLNSDMWVYAKSLTQTYAKGKSTSGTVTFDANPPDESGAVSWPLGVGSYQVHIIRDGSSPYPVAASSTVFTISSGAPSPTTGSPTPAPVPAPSDTTALTVSKASYAEGEDIVIDFAYPNNPGVDAWIGLWPADSDPQSLPSPSSYWNYICSDSQSSACGTQPVGGAVSLNGDSTGGSSTWPLTCGTWKAYLIPSGAVSSFYSSAAASEAFVVGGSAICESQVCNAAPQDGNPTNTHLVPTDGAQINKIAFGSCYSPNGQNSPTLWQHVRTNFGSDSGNNGLWNWLGDNMYQDSNDSQAKRNAYDAARNHPYYVQYGPVANPKIPTTGTWDDHDYGFNNDGNNYECRQSSQNEFVYHFNVPDTDPRHPAYAGSGGQRQGIYSSNMFQTNAGTPGIHLINLDARYHRSPTFSSKGTCRGASSTILGSEQWTWLENELRRPSELKIIGSGTQVLPPTNRGRSVTSYCAYDGNGNTFDTANAEIDEGPSSDGTTYESWAEIPQERTRLLKLVQQSINAGNANHVVFISGDQHWAEMMVKEIPARSGQSAVSVYEVTGSGIDQSWPFTIANSNRLRPESYGFRVRRDLLSIGTSTQKGRNTVADAEGKKLPRGLRKKTSSPSNAPVVTPAPTKFPTSAPTPVPATAIKSITYSGSNTCSGDALHICSAKANYGGIEVDWANQEVHLSIFTPFETVQEAVRVTLDLTAAAATDGGEIFI